MSPIDSINENEWLSMTEASALTPYSAEYLSLLCRTGKLSAKKVGKVWYTTTPVLKEYMDRQMFRVQVLKGGLPTAQASKVSVAVTPETLRTSEVDPSVSQPSPLSSVSDVLASVKSEPVSTPLGIEKVVSSLSDSLGTLSKKISELNVAPSKQNDEEFFGKLSAKLNDFVDRKIEKTSSVSEGTRQSSGNGAWRAVKHVVSKKVLLLPTLFLIVGLAVFPIPFVHSFVDSSFQALKNTLRDSQTVLGFRPGTHKNEILLLNKKGDISIQGHIETEGQFRSFAKDGIAPIIVDSKTRVDNLNADRVDDLSSEEFTLAFVTKNGNVTSENVFLNGRVEVGKTLLVKGATKLLSDLDVAGNITAGGNVTVTGDVQAESLRANNLIYGKTVVGEDFVTGKHVEGALITGGVITARDVLESAGNFTARGSSNFLGFAYFDKGLQGTSGTFRDSLDVGGNFVAGGEVRLGSEGNNKDLTIASRNITLDRDGNLAINGQFRPFSILTRTLEVTGTSTFSGSATFDTDTLFIDTGNHLVGMGTTTPSGKLTIAGSSDLISLYDSTGSTTLRFVVNANGNVGIGTSSPTDAFSLASPIFLGSTAPATTSNRLYATNSDLYWAGNLIGGSTTGNWTTDGTNVWRAGGNVGIGTSSPYAMLSVAGQIVGQNFVATSTTATSTFAGGLYVGTSTPHFAVDIYGGNVGVNMTTGNLNPLDFGGGVLAVSGKKTATNGNIQIIGRNMLNTNPIGRLAFTHNVSETYTNVAFIQANRASADDAADITFYTKATGATIGEKVRISSTGFLGIATSTPWGLLSVNPDALGTGVPEFVVGSSTATHFVVQGNGSVGIGTSAQSSYLLNMASAGGNILSYTRTAGTNIGDVYFDMSNVNGNSNSLGSFEIKTSSSTAYFAYRNQNNYPFVASPAGNFGINNVVNPTYNLDVSGNAHFTSYVDASYFTATSTTATSTISTGGLAIGTSTPSGSSLFTVGTSSPLLYVDKITGRVGLKTSNPTASLDITYADPSVVAVNAKNTDTTARTFVTAANDSGKNLTILAYGSAYVGTFAGIDAANAVQVSGGTSPSSMFIGESSLASSIYLGHQSAIIPAITLLKGSTTQLGSVGIGTTTPGATFSIAGNAGQTKPIFLISSSTSAFATSTVASIDSNGNALFGFGGGNVGIGTAVPLANLHIQPSTGSGEVWQWIVNSRDTTAPASMYVENDGGKNLAIKAYGSASAATLFGSAAANAVTLMAGGANAGLFIGHSGANKATIFGQGSIENMRIAALTGYLGIGTTTPTNTLGVHGTGYISGSLFVGGTITSTSSAPFTLSGMPYNSLLSTNGSGVVTATSTPNFNAFNATSTTATSTISTGGLAIGTSTPFGGGLFTVGTSTPLFYVDRTNGKVGIGVIPSPSSSHILDVYSNPGSTGTQVFAGFGGLTTQNATIYLESINGLPSVTSRWNHDLLFAVNDSERMRISTSGFLGIGTTSPSNLLSVHGNGYISSNLFVGGTITSTSSTPFTLSGIAANSLLATNASGNVIATSTPTFGNFNATSTVATSTIGTGGFAVGTSQFVVQQTSGNVGVGTTSPSEKLSIVGGNFLVTGSLRPEIKVAGSDYPGRYGRFTALVGNAYNTFNAYYDGSNWQRDDIDVGSSNVNYGSGAIRGRVTGSGSGNITWTEAFYVNTTGFGIGTTSPWRTLSVHGSSDLGINALAGYFTATTSTASVFPYASTTAISSSGSAYFATSGGNVGIGTTTPNSILNISGATPKLTLSNTSGGTNLKHWYMQSSAGDFIIATTSDALVDTALPAFTILDTSGNVGIGTAAPGYKLEVAQGLSATGALIGVVAGNGNTNPASLLLWNNNIGLQTLAGEVQFSPNGSKLVLSSIGGGWSTSTNSGYLGFFTSSNGGSNRSERMRVESNGNVGIGTTSPSNLLSVHGSGYISSNLFVGGTITSTSSTPFTLSGMPFNSLLSTNSTGVLTATSTPTFGNFNATSTVATSTIGTGGFTVGTSQFVVQQTSGNVGIGTTTISKLLTLGVTTSDDGLSIVRNASNSELARLFMDGTNDRGRLALFNGGTIRTNLIANADSYINSTAGNLGIGTTGPGNQLTISTSSTANLSASTGLKVINTLASGYANLSWGNDSANIAQVFYTGSTFTNGIWGGNEGGLNSGGTGGVSLVAYDTAGIIKFGTGGSAASNERMRITATGNVGIGTTSPWGKLSINNSTSDTAGQPLFVIASSTATATTTIFLVTSTGVGIGTTTVLAPLHIGGAGAGNDTTIGGNNGSNIAANAYVTSGIGWRYIKTGAAVSLLGLNVNGSTAGDVGIYTAPAGTAGNAVTLTNRLMVLEGGNVGIGTTTPGSLLSVHGSGYISSNLFVGGTITSTSSTPFTLSGMPFNSLLSTNATGVLTATSTPTFGNFNATSTVATSTISTGGFAVGTSQFVVQQTSGNVGIGTTSPASLLTVAGDAEFGKPALTSIFLRGSTGTAFSFNRNPTSGVMTNSNAFGYQLNHTESTTNTSDYLSWLVYNPSGSQVTASALVINGLGNVGIGTTTPSAKLDVQDGMIRAKGSATAPTTGQGLEIAYISDTYGQMTSYNRTAGAYTQLRIDGLTTLINSGSGGNVGIGTTTPSVKLGVYTTATTLAAMFQGSGGGAVGIGGNGIGVIQAYTNDSGTATGNLALNYLGGNVGIGTTTPGSLLSVHGNGYISSNLFVGGAITSTSTLASTFPYASTTAISSSGSAYFATSGGNVGIGTANPLLRLHVNVGTNQNFWFRSTGSLATFETANDAGNANVEMDLTALNFKFTANASTAMTISTTGLVTVGNASTTQIGSTGSAYFATSGGNVGIATTSPLGLFSITGSRGYLTYTSAGQLSMLGTDETASNQTDFTMRIGASNVNGANLIFQKGRTNDGGAANANPGASTYDQLGSVQFQGGTGSAFAEAARIRAIVDVSGNWGVGDTPAALTFWTTANGSGTIGERMRIDNAGNVGIGTTTPGSLLSVHGNGYISSNLFVGGTITSTSSTPFTLSGMPFNSLLSTNASGVLTATSTPTFGNFNATSTVATSTIGTGGFTVGTSQFVVQQTSGNVGIGTAAPGLTTLSDTNDRFLSVVTTSSNRAGVVEVAGNSGTNVGGGNPVGVLRFTNNNAGTYVALADIRGSRVSTGINYGQLSFVTASNGSLTEKMTILDTGNVGIGTTTPWGKLSVTNTGTAPSFVVEDSTSPDTTPFIIDASGNVGIGTTSPYAQLSVGGTSALNNLIAFVSTNNNFSFSDNSSSASPVWNFTNTGTYAATRFYVQDANNSSSRLTFDFRGNAGSNLIMAGTSAGNVGVGTTSPATLLHVSGSSPIIRIGSSVVDTLGKLDFFDQTTGVASGGVSGSPNAGNPFVLLFSGTTGVNQIGLYKGDQSTRFTNNSVETMRIVNGGNVGIGTTTPASLLSVHGSGYISSNLFVGGTITSTSSTPFTLSGMPYNSLLSTNASGVVTATSTPNFNNFNATSTVATSTISTGGFTVGTSQFVVQQTSGNVGIGTVSPRSKLSILGDGTSLDLARSFTTAQTAPTTPNHAASYLNIGGQEYGLNSYRMISFGYASLSSVNVPAYIAYVEKDSSSLTAGDLVFATRVDSNDGVPIERLTITTTGNVGIGTTSPYAQLSVTNTTSAPSFVVEDSTSPDTTPFIIDASGLVGISTTTPIGKLSARGASLGTVTLAPTSFTGVGSGNIQMLIEDQSNSTTQDYWQFLTRVSEGGFSIANVGDNAVRLHIDTSGNVGIATTSPVSTLSIQGSLCVRNTGSCGTTAGTIYATTNTVQAIDLAENYSTSDNTLVPGELVSLDTGSSTYIKRADGSGTLLGVVSTAPGVLLGSDVANGKPVALKGRVPVFVNSEGGSIAIGDRIMLSSTDGVGMRQVQSGQTIGVALEEFTGANGTIEVFIDLEQVYTQDQFMIDVNGNVGIGTTTPSYKLHVDGDVAAQSFVNISTREAKKDIAYLTDADKTSVLAKIKTLGVATYTYKNEPACQSGITNNQETISNGRGCASRLGLIAEEAPAEVLSANGKGVDVYKLSSFILAGVQEQQKQIDAIDLRLTKLEQVLASSTPSTVADESSLLAIFERLGAKFTNGLLELKRLAVASLTVGASSHPEGITLYDQVTKEPYCLTIANGTTKSTAGVCGDAGSSTNSDSVAPTITIIGNNPATLVKGSVYADLGALVTDNVSTNLGYTVSGLELIDTSTTTTYTIIYTAIDGAGNHATSTRTVIVSESTPVAVTPVSVENETTTAPIVTETASTSTPALSVTPAPESTPVVVAPTLESVSTSTPEVVAPAEITSDSTSSPQATSTSTETTSTPATSSTETTTATSTEVTVTP